MKRDWKYIAFLGSAILFFLVLKMLSPRQYNWTITFNRDDKNPFGGYALSELMPEILPGAAINQNYYTFYELSDTLKRPVNFISISTRFAPGKSDLDALLRNIEAGGTAFISAQYFSGHFADSLDIYTSDYFFEKRVLGYFNENDTTQLYFKNPSLSNHAKLEYPRKNIHNYFNPSDSVTYTVVAENDVELPITIKINHGKGFLIVNSTPLVFTNAYMLTNDNAQLAEHTLSMLPVRETLWTEYYHLGRMESRTPLRFILKTEPLRWAYYIVILSLLIFILFEVKRKQRIIPIIKPLQNTTLEFIGTITNLYFKSADHKNILEKRISFLLERLRTMYGFSIYHRTEESLQNLAARTGNDVEFIQQLMMDIDNVHQQKSISLQELERMSQKIDNFKLG